MAEWENLCRFILENVEILAYQFRNITWSFDIVMFWKFYLFYIAYDLRSIDYLFSSINLLRWSIYILLLSLRRLIVNIKV